MFSVKNGSIISSNTFTISITDTRNDYMGHQGKINLNSKKAVLGNSFYYFWYYDYELCKWGQGG